ncbi:hypothetical protein GCM10020295_32610 [Streptomyces cinereospinus]
MALLPVDYGLLCLVFLFLGHRTVFLALYVALLAAHAVLLPAFLAKWFRELSRRTRTESSGVSEHEDARQVARIRTITD